MASFNAMDCGLIPSIYLGEVRFIDRRRQGRWAMGGNSPCFLIGTTPHCLEVISQTHSMPAGAQRRAQWKLRFLFLKALYINVFTQ